jgi:metal-sulfur cluster biosynthetic enzyme
MLRENVREAVQAVPGVTKVVVEEGWHLPWSRDMIEPEVQEMMRANGIQV